MNLFKKATRHGKVSQKIMNTLYDTQMCLVLAHAACILMAANPRLSPHDAARDAYQVYSYLMAVKLHRTTAPD